MTLRFTVYGKPTPGGSKTTGRTKTGRTYIRDANPKAAEWKRTIAQQVGQAMDGQPLLEGPLELHLAFHIPRPAGHYGKRGLLPSARPYPTVAPDILKLTRIVEDALTGTAIRDDAKIVSEYLHKRYGEPARVDITILTIKNDREEYAMNELSAREIADQASADAQLRETPEQEPTSDTPTEADSLEAIIRETVHQELKTVMAAALADPGVNPQAKSLAGYTLDYLSQPAEAIEADRAAVQEREAT